VVPEHQQAERRAQDEAPARQLFLALEHEQEVQEVAEKDEAHDLLGYQVGASG
jgi:hypothetical protein